MIEPLRDADPDALIRHVEDAVERWRAERLAAVADPDPAPSFLSLQPRLDGLGGRVVGELDAEGLALLDAATAPTPAQRTDPAGAGAARARNLLTRLAGVAGAGVSGGSPSTEARAADAMAAGAMTDSGASDAAPRPGPATLPPVQLLLRVDLDALLDRNATPATLLTRLLGGRLRLTSGAARRLVDERGAQLRSVVIDDVGRVVGVGRGTRVPPGWLRDALLSVHDTCTGPLCDRPALGADTDHALPWWPERAGDLPGTTDIDNLGPLCASTNRALRRAGWTATQLGDGRRRWLHRASGLAITSVPSSWRPPPRGSPPLGETGRAPAVDPRLPF
ncbi:MAG: HNH endonuclease [Nitriliruptoraceae bacterium]|nr:HNH endonuclease [Nitriliruptoraceae bacterium]